MYTTIFTVALLFAPALADFAISTPTLVQCQEAKITWEKADGPYNLIVVPAADPCGDAIADLGDHAGTSMTYKVALPAGEKVLLSMVDAAGDEAWSGEVVIGKSDDSSCVPKALLAAASSSAVVSSTAAVSSSSSVVADRTSLVIPPASTTASSAASSSGSAIAIGAANAGTNPFGGSDSNGAPALSVGAPLIVLSVIAGAFVLAF